MQIFLFVIDGKPGFRTELVPAQACLEGHLQERRDVSEVWWDDEYPYQARLYLYDGASHRAFMAIPEGENETICYETTDQLIFPVEIGDVTTGRGHLDILDPGAAHLSLSVVTETGTEEVTRVVPQWPTVVARRTALLASFAWDTASAMAGRWADQEGS